MPRPFMLVGYQRPDVIPTDGGRGSLLNVPSAGSNDGKNSLLKVSADAVAYR